MRLVRSTALLLALACAVPASAGDPTPPAQAGETIALGNDGPFSEPHFEVIRDLTGLRDAFAGEPPREDVDFAKGPLILYAAPNGPAPLITGVAPLGGRLDVRVKAVDPALLGDRVTGNGRGARYHLVQVPTPALSQFSASRSLQPKSVDVVLAADGKSFQDAVALTGRQAVLLRETRGETSLVSPAGNPNLKTEVPSAWLSAARGENVPADARFLTIPAGKKVALGGNYRYHPTDPTLIPMIAGEPTLRGKLMRLSGAVYEPTGPRVDIAIDVTSIDPLNGRNAIPFGATPERQVAAVLDYVFPLKGASDPDAGLATGPVLASASKTETPVEGSSTPTITPTLPASSETEVAATATTETPSEVAATATTETPSSTTPATDLTKTEGQGGGMTGVVGEVAAEIEQANQPTQVADGPSGIEGEQLTKVEDGPEGAEGTPLTKPETETAATATTETPSEVAATATTETPSEVAATATTETPSAATDTCSAHTDVAQATETPASPEGQTVATTAEPTSEGATTQVQETEVASATQDQETEVASTQVQEPEAQAQETEAQAQETEAQTQETEAVSFPYKGRVNVSELNVRDAPNHDAKGLLVFFENREVEVVGQADNGWLVVKVPQLEGYLAQNVIDFPNGKGKKGGPATVKISFVNLRTGPGSTAAVDVMLRQDFPLTVRRTGHRGNWLSVTSAGEFQAFVHGKYITKVE